MRNPGVSGHDLPPTVACELCGHPTKMLGTKRCDRCWELESRVLDDIDLTLAILHRAGLLCAEYRDDDLLPNRAGDAERRLRAAIAGDAFSPPQRNPK